MDLNAPWLNYSLHVPKSLEYPDCSMSDMVIKSAARYPDVEANNFFGSKVTYSEFASQVNECARALAAAGVNRGERVTICMPNTLQAVIMFYAVNRIGAVANMVHPLSAKEEIVSFINGSRSVAALTLDQFYPKFASIINRTLLRTLVVRWQDFIRNGRSFSGQIDVSGKGDDLAAILYSGGTSGTIKGILLTNLNFNGLALQTIAAGDCVVPGHVMLAVMPVFYRFGLDVCIHTMFISGVKHNG